MTKQSFIKGTLILLAAGILNRLLGFIPRIALPRIIGPEGVGIYQLGYPFFIVLVTIITGGIPLAIAKMVAEAEGAGKPDASKQILRVSLTLTVTTGALFMGLSLALAPWVTTVLLPDERVFQTFVSMTPMMIIIAVSAVYRGYFQGKQNMIPSASSSVIETIVRIICMLWFAHLLMPKGIAYGAAGAMLGTAVGELIGMIAILLQYFGDDRKRSKLSPQQHAVQPADAKPEASEPGRHILRRMLGIALPVTGGRMIGSFSYLLETILTNRSLALAGIATGIATAQYGALQGMAIPLLLLPGAMAMSLATSLVPSLSEAAARDDRATIHKRMNQALRLALVTGAPFATIMYVLAEPLCLLLYNNKEVGTMLKLMAPFALFIYVQAPLQAALQALDRPGRALINTLTGAVIKMGLIVYLASNPAFGIRGAIIAIIVNSIAVTILHGISVSRLIGFRFRFLDYIKTAAVMLIMGSGVLYAYRHLPFANMNWLQFLLATACGILMYLLLIFITRLVTLRDLERMPLIGTWLNDRKSR
ncbi:MULTISPECIES: stage V sporulation protein B [Paenibacillus]|uniref:Stage V sporulation protein B n=1 Tax=Paenibacillus campinasensis TaxID=66347 RepID=A0A268F587_9BACL|nr:MULTISPECIES: stage V sporulation protein B [Paenibacillus]MUG64406.1 stage V sporulation protein B [Paenibacillus campinasensis]PAD80533.1 stage V sporulation protein B [Paenibacillus campinasensis]PAK55130.1 stage V sporulation protein B [Paenibacillus sp. 7541]